MRRLIPLLPALILLTGLDLPGEPPVPAPNPLKKEVESKPPVTIPTRPPDKVSGDDEAKTPPLDEAKPPPLKVDEAAIRACEAALTQLGAKFKRLPPIRGEGGCGLAAPYAVTEIAPGIKLTPATKMQCDVALATARWVKDVVLPAARVYSPDHRLTSIRHASTYVCRSRNHKAGAKLSEHATGNAIDIVGFTFGDKEQLVVQPRNRDADLSEAFQKAIRFGACLHFTTVIGPLSDANHADHFHLDLADRNRGYRLCRFPEEIGIGN